MKVNKNTIKIATYIFLFICIIVHILIILPFTTFASIFGTIMSGGFCSIPGVFLITVLPPMIIYTISSLPLLYINKKIFLNTIAIAYICNCILSYGVTLYIISAFPK